MFMDSSAHLRFQQEGDFALRGSLTELNLDRSVFHHKLLPSTVGNTSLVYKINANIVDSIV